MNSEVFMEIIMAIISVIGALISAYLIPHLKSQVTSEQLANIDLFVSKAVRCAEQLYTPEEWREKKNYVTECAREFLHKARIDLTDEQLDTIIEGIVNEVKKGGAS